MSVMISEDKKDFIVDCKCGCCEGIRFRFDKDDEDWYLLLSITSGDFYNKQNKKWHTLKEKIKRIWFVLKNRDYLYCDIILSKKDFDEFKKLINHLEDN